MDGVWEHFSFQYFIGSWIQLKVPVSPMKSTIQASTESQMIETKQVHMYGLRGFSVLTF